MSSFSEILTVLRLARMPTSFLHPSGIHNERLGYEGEARSTYGTENVKGALRKKEI